MQPLAALGALNVFDLRKTEAPQPASRNPFMGAGEIAMTSGNYSLNHPRANDSAGVPAGTSHLARKLDVCW